jgi:hypothetical protein
MDEWRGREQAHLLEDVALVELALPLGPAAEVKELFLFLLVEGELRQRVEHRLGRWGTDVAVVPAFPELVSSKRSAPVEWLFGT